MAPLESGGATPARSPARVCARACARACYPVTLSPIFPIRFDRSYASVRRPNSRKYKSRLSLERGGYEMRRLYNIRRRASEAVFGASRRFNGKLSRRRHLASTSSSSVPVTIQ
ncbi:hypothetical protein EVAR_20200_1 [Eumeta japonica]|uniref:Uncharacterized protein n=1 Tax=Eumeta variegata TaxID=151549 RepID=A0A4C1UUG5_EUMVA|nr:hypothetical protein EVAR_20200_1 [Eumeta japonica]